MSFPRPIKPRIIAVANQKGGVGKTTSTVNLAAGLAKNGLDVLVIDLDPQGNASTGFGVEHRSGTPSTYEVLIDGRSLTSVVSPSPESEQLLVAPATIDLAGAEIELVSVVARETRLKRALEKYDRPVDYVLLDCPPSLGLLTINGMVAADEVLIPIQCEYYALEGLSQLLRNIELVKTHLNPGLHVSTILLTMYDSRTRLADQVANDVREHFGTTVLSSVIPRSVRISEAPGYGQSVLTYDGSSRGALAYLEAAREIALRGAVGIPEATAPDAVAPIAAAAAPAPEVIVPEPVAPVETVEAPWAEPVPVLLDHVDESLEQVHVATVAADEAAGQREAVAGLPSAPWAEPVPVLLEQQAEPAEPAEHQAGTDPMADPTVPKSEIVVPELVTVPAADVPGESLGTPTILPKWEF